MSFIAIFFLEITKANLDNLVAIQVSVSGIWSILCIIWKVLGPCLNYLDILDAIAIKEAGGITYHPLDDRQKRKWKENNLQNLLLEAKELGLLN